MLDLYKPIRRWRGLPPRGPQPRPPVRYPRAPVRQSRAPARRFPFKPRRAPSDNASIHGHWVQKARHRIHPNTHTQLLRQRTKKTRKQRGATHETRPDTTKPRARKGVLLSGVAFTPRAWGDPRRQPQGHLHRLFHFSGGGAKKSM
jgi:hypothetical protein